MTDGSVAGLLALNAAYLLVGYALLWALRGLRTFGDAARVVGVAYMVGFTVIATLVTQLVIAGLPASWWVAGLTCLTVGGGALAAGQIRGRPRHEAETGRPIEPLPWLGLAFLAGIAVVMAAVLRLAWSKPLVGWDAWAFWTPKAISIHEFGGLQESVWSSIPAQSYPILLPVVQALSFSAMGAVDTTLIHLQPALLFCGFFVAVAGLLRPRVPHLLLWPVLALLVFVPRFAARSMTPEADYLVHYVFVLGTMCLGLWLLRREAWLLLISACFLIAGVSVKREGMLFLAAALVGGFVAARGSRWYVTLRLAAIAAAAGVTALTWQIWLERHAIPPSPTGRITGDGGIVGDVAEEPERVLPAVRSVVESVFAYGSWGLAPFVGGLSLLSAVVLLKDRRLPVVLIVASAVAFAGFVWRILWGTASTAFDAGSLPTGRVVGAVVLLWLATTPLFLAEVAETRAWGAVSRRLAGRSPSAAAFGAVALVPAAVYLAASSPVVPEAQLRCSVPATAAGQVELVFTRTDSIVRAEPMRRRIVALGFVGTEVARDRCGRVKVYVPYNLLRSLRVAREVAAEARSAGLAPTLERP